MTSIKDKTHVFIVRIWSEPREIKYAPPEWRGVIEHVASGDRQYLKNLNEILEFVTPYLATMGVKLPLLLRFKQWSKIFRLFPKDQ